MRTHPNLSLLEECFAKGRALKSLPFLHTSDSLRVFRSAPGRDLGIGREYIFLIILLLVCENFYEVQHLFPLALGTRRVGEGFNQAKIF